VPTSHPNSQKAHAKANLWRAFYPRKFVPRKHLRHNLGHRKSQGAIAADFKLTQSPFFFFFLCSGKGTENAI